MSAKDRMVIPSAIAMRLLGNPGEAEWRRLIAERVVEVAVKRTNRGAQVATNFRSIERAEAAIAAQ